MPAVRMKFSCTNGSRMGKGNTSNAVASSLKQKVPKIDRPEVKQDISDEDWQSFEAEWKRFKRCTEMRNEEVADQLFQCCDMSLMRLLLKVNPDIIEEGEDALMMVMKHMAFLYVATFVRRTKLLSTRQVQGQTLGNFTLMFGPPLLHVNTASNAHTLSAMEIVQRVLWTTLQW